MLALIINMLVNVFCTLIVVQALLSWFIRPGSQFYSLYCLLDSLTAPLVNPWRRLCQGFTYRMGVDFSPVIAILAIEVAGRALIRLIYFF